MQQVMKQGGKPFGALFYLIPILLMQGLLLSSQRHGYATGMRTGWTEPLVVLRFFVQAIHRKFSIYSRKTVESIANMIGTQVALLSMTVKVVVSVINVVLRVVRGMNLSEMDSSNAWKICGGQWNQPARPLSVDWLRRLIMSIQSAIAPPLVACAT